jgi:hypothetical protein
MHNTYQASCQSRLYTADYALSYLACATTTVSRLTATMFKPLIFPVSAFVLSHIANICIFMSLYDFWLLPAVVLKSHAVRCETNGTGSLLVQGEGAAAGP